jgi:myosin heavy chain 6/7
MPPKTPLFCVHRKSSARVIEELQRTLVEVETRYKQEISRMKKKYETDIRELEGALDNANRANAEYLKQIKSLQIRVKVRHAVLKYQRSRSRTILRSMYLTGHRSSLYLFI